MKTNVALKTDSHPLTITEELFEIQKKNGGILNPRDVVNYARNKFTALHKKFQWDDTIAAEEYRIWQARHIIRLEVDIIPPVSTGKRQIVTDIKTAKQTRSFISLSTDREADGGYRSMVAVLSNKSLREQMLEDAKNDMNIFRRKYAVLSELAEVFAAMDKIR